MRSPLLEPLHALADGWSAVVRSSGRRLALALIAAVWAIALLIARQGTPPARLVAAGAAVSSVGLAIGWEIIARRRAREPARLLRGPARRVDVGRAESALRALAFVGPEGEMRAEGVSLELVTLHLSRALSALPSGPILAQGVRVGQRVKIAAAAVGVAVVAFVLSRPWSILEGADVLVAQAAVAPVPMTWLDRTEVDARPPEYLHESEIHEIELTSLALPFGTTISVRGRPVRPGRLLVLSDGTTEVPFVEDGAGAVVARWSLAASGTLRVVARFGDVVIPQGEALDVRSIPDEAPVVRLEGAPRQLRLVDEVEDIVIKYEASDDHGLREVHLVLRSGTREERRVLARLDGETQTDAGGQVLRLARSLPQEEPRSRRGDRRGQGQRPAQRPEMGRERRHHGRSRPTSASPRPGASMRCARLRDALVDSLAWRLEHGPPQAAADAQGLRRRGEEARGARRAAARSDGGGHLRRHPRAVADAAQCSSPSAARRARRSMPSWPRRRPIRTRPS